MKKVIIYALASFCSVFVYAQTNIGPGIVNFYYPVTGITAGTGTCNPAGSQTLQLGAPSGGTGTGAPVISATPGAHGNLVLVIQMRAGSSASINQGSAYEYRSPADATGSCSHGDINTLGSVGNYEFTFVSTWDGTNITFTRPLTHNYDIPEGAVQVIPVAGYTDATTGAITSTGGEITALRWDSTAKVGGVIAIAAGGTLALRHNINADFKGYNGADTINTTNEGINGGCCNNSALLVSRYRCYFDASNSTNDCYGTLAGRMMATFKGEGIISPRPGEELGYAHIANGAGGGGGHNSGGGGGGGYAGGGNGGYEYEACKQGATPWYKIDDLGGRGGIGLPSSGSGGKMFMGGGGGAGHGNQFIFGSTTGGDGGGIVIIEAGNIFIAAAGSAKKYITARGDSALTPVGAYSDASGGGGGGGAILIENHGSWTMSDSLIVSAQGGNGGDNLSSKCHGTGGGGGGGYAGISAYPGSNFRISTAPGDQGTFRNDPTGCGDYGSSIGASGLSTTGDTVYYSNCNPPLPVTLVSFYGQIDNHGDAFLNWTTSSEVNSSHFIIERSQDGSTFTGIGQEGASGNSFFATGYTYTDFNFSNLTGVVYYRLKLVDIDGSYQYSEIISLSTAGELVELYPNPVTFGELSLKYEAKIDEEIEISVIDVLGKVYFTKKESIERGLYVSTIPINQLSKGVYFVLLKNSSKSIINKLIRN